MIRLGDDRWLLGLALVLTALPAAVVAQEQEDPEWDVTLARGETREIEFTTSEATWPSVDVSPDGTWLVFDMLGHVYRMPASGGTAQSLTQSSGVAINVHPRISPDGRHIAFISDRGGQNNLWIMNADGSEPRAVFTDADSRAVTPAWTPDGQYIVVRRQSVGGGGNGNSTSGLWMYHRDGGDGVRLVEGGAARWPSVSPDGRFLFFAVSDGGNDALRGHYQVRRLDIRSGDIVEITTGNADGAASSRLSSGGAFAPEISPDGRWLAFARQIPDGTVSWKGHSFGPRTALWLRDLETGAERVVMDPISIAVESGSKTLRMLPGYAWTEDSRSIYIAEGGGISRLDVAAGTVTPIGFEARVQRTISEQAYSPFRIEDGPFEAKFLRWHTGSPDGGRVAFQAIGRIWLSELPTGTPRRLTPPSFSPAQEFAPAWSPDGQWIAFTTWDDTLGGHVWKVPVSGGEPVRLTTDAGEYVHPAWSADGTELVLARGAGATARGRTLTHNPWWDVVRVPAGTGPATPVRVTRVPLPADAGPSSTARHSILAPSWGP
ncbi:MAG: hypothetical protein ACRELX_13585, partial [Longimicrobiales bacterium]